MVGRICETGRFFYPGMTECRGTCRTVMTEWLTHWPRRWAGRLLHLIDPTPLCAFLAVSRWWAAWGDVMRSGVVCRWAGVLLEPASLLFLVDRRRTERPTDVRHARQTHQSVQPPRHGALPRSTSPQLYHVLKTSQPPCHGAVPRPTTLLSHIFTALYHVLQVHNSTTSWKLKLLNHLATALYHVLQHFSATSPPLSTTSYNTSQPPLHRALPRPTTLLSHVFTALYHVIQVHNSTTSWKLLNHLATALYHVLQVHNSTTSWKLLNHVATALYHVLQHFSTTSPPRCTTSYNTSPWVTVPRHCIIRWISARFTCEERKKMQSSANCCDWNRSVWWLGVGNGDIFDMWNFWRRRWLNQTFSTLEVDRIRQKGYPRKTWWVGVKEDMYVKWCQVLIWRP